MKIILKLFLISIIAIFNSCSLLPPSPNEPFYCKINGKVFRPEKDNSPFGGVGTSPLQCQWDSKLGWFYINVVNGNDVIIFFIKLNPNETIQLGDYKLTKDEELGSKAIYIYEQKAAKFSIEKLRSTEGFLTITKIENKVVSGTFSFKTYSKILNKEFTITKGQFNELFPSKIN